MNATVSAVAGPPNAVSRRASISAISAAAVLAALGASSPAGVKKKRKGKSPARVRCQRQVEKCRPAVDLQCETVFAEWPELIAQCKEDFVPCCDLLATCDLFATLSCMIPAPSDGEERADLMRLF